MSRRNQAQAAEFAAAKPNSRYWTINRSFQPGMQRNGAISWTGDQQTCGHAKTLAFTTVRRRWRLPCTSKLYCRPQLPLLSACTGRAAVHRLRHDLARRHGPSAPVLERGLPAHHARASDARDAPLPVPLGWRGRTGQSSLVECCSFSSAPYDSIFHSCV